MSDGSAIVCPKCQHAFPLNAAIAQPIIDRLRTQFEAEAKQRESVVAERERKLLEREQSVKLAQQSVQQQVEQKLTEERKRISAEQEKKAREEVAVQLHDLQNQLNEKANKLAVAQQEQLEFLKQKRLLDEQRQSFELEKVKQIEAERDRIREEATKAAAEQATKEMSELQQKIAAKDKKLAEAEQAELKLRQEKADFEEQKRAFDLEMARQAELVKEAVRKEKDEEFRLKEAEANAKLDAMKRQIDELKRKAEQGSQQAQGEVLELDLENALKRCFDSDEISPVPKGAHGGDILQRVRGDLGSDCGTILWESKRTKAWSDGWLQKLKDDKLAAKAQLAIIVSTAMPKDAASFECREGVWVTPPNLAVPLAAALRLSLIETAAARRAIEGRHDKMEVVYDYLSGPEFKGRVTAIVESFTTMREDLEAEKKAVQKLWAKREKQIERVLGNTAGMYGDLSGIIGKSLPAIEQLEFAALPNGDGEPVAAAVAN